VPDDDLIRTTRTKWRGDTYRVYELFYGGFKVERNLGGGNWEFVDRFPSLNEAIRCAALLEAREISLQAQKGDPI
jgi:hypothetical protein